MRNAILKKVLAFALSLTLIITMAPMIPGVAAKASAETLPPAITIDENGVATWEEVEGATKYWWQIEGNGGWKYNGSSGVNLKNQLANLDKPSGTYTFKVRSYDGNSVAVCEEATAEYNYIRTHEHIWAEEWQSDDTSHWHECTVDGCMITNKVLKASYGTHEYVGGVCVCGKERVLLSAPTITIDENGVATCTEVEGAAKYSWLVSRASSILGQGESYDVYNTLVGLGDDSGQYEVMVYAMDVDNNTISETATITYNFTSPHTHVWDYEKWEYDGDYGDEYHWHPCTAENCLTPNYLKEGVSKHDYGTTGVCECGKEEVVVLKPAPTITIDENGVATWEEVEGATQYWWQIEGNGGWKYNGSSGVNLKNQLANLDKPSGTYTFKVRSYDGNSVAVCEEATAEYNYTRTHEHIWAEEWQSDDTSHWHECTVDGCMITNKVLKGSYGAHEYVDGVCVCGKENVIPSAVTLSATNYTYDGKAKTPEVTVKDGDKTLVNGTDYKVDYSNNINAGTAKVTITGIGDYTGTVTKNFTIAKQAYSSKFKTTLSTTNYTYNGSAKTPSVTVYNAAGKKLVNGTDYSVSYASGRKNIGKYKVTITFKGNYSGSKALYFEIGPKNPSSVKTALYGYDDVKVSWSKVSGASGYKVYYKKSTASSWTLLKTTTATSYKKANLSDGVKYNFKVVAYKKVSGNACENAGKTSSIYTLKKVAGVKAAKSGSKVKVSWTNISGETGYQISQATSKSKTKVVATYKTTSGKYKTVSAKKGKTYYYKVRAYKVVDGKKIYGPWSSVVKYKR